MSLARKLHTAGIARVVPKRRLRAFVEGRVRAGLLNPITIARLRELAPLRGPCRAAGDGSKEQDRHIGAGTGRSS